MIGIHESELHLPQTILIDVCAGLARVPACDTDRIADTLDYGELRLRLMTSFFQTADWMRNRPH